MSNAAVENIVEIVLKAFAAVPFVHHRTPPPPPLIRNPFYGNHLRIRRSGPGIAKGCA
jgi:hypothetical protein